MSETSTSPYINLGSNLFLNEVKYLFSNLFLYIFSKNGFTIELNEVVKNWGLWIVKFFHEYLYCFFHLRI